MFNFSDKAAIKINDLLIFDHDKIIENISKNQALFKDLVLDYSPSKQTAYGYNRFGHMIKISYRDDMIEKIVLVTDKPEYLRKKLIVSYDGSNFFGFQYQSKHRTIQGEITKVLKEINRSDELIQGASRTDTGVHAYEQVLHFDTTMDISNEKWIEILNHQLPNDILVKVVEDVHPLFHSRYDVYKKRYVYKISLDEINPFLINYYHFEKSLNIEIMKKNIKYLLGTHDFTSFSKSAVDDPYRTIHYAEIIKKDGVLYIEIEGNGFLRYMVRIIVEYLLKLGKGKTSMSIKDVLEVKSRKHTNSMAKAEGLYLEHIIY
ncbi:MAG: tRNA pseudouridine(38-40) synthase TruA [Tenericutes bacterium]|jgi:tRNA pseudouridine38-40 synthase|nr:tRNA pseudouridine(38-40) synthase TruA [Mycoplasmatota bacterium]